MKDFLHSLDDSFFNSRLRIGLLVKIIDAYWDIVQGNLDSRNRRNNGFEITDAVVKRSEIVRQLTVVHILTYVTDG